MTALPHIRLSLIFHLTGPDFCGSFRRSHMFVSRAVTHHPEILLQAHCEKSLHIHRSDDAHPENLLRHQCLCYHSSSSSCPMLVVQARRLAYPFRPHAKTAADRTQKRSFTTKPKAIQPPPLPNKNAMLGIGSIVADRYRKHKTSPTLANGKAITCAMSCDLS